MIGLKFATILRLAAATAILGLALATASTAEAGKRDWSPAVASGDTLGYQLVHGGRHGYGGRHGQGYRYGYGHGYGHRYGHRHGFGHRHGQRHHYGHRRGHRHHYEQRHGHGRRHGHLGWTFGYYGYFR